jgi:hypothetical protein
MARAIFWISRAQIQIVKITAKETDDLDKLAIFSIRRGPNI